MLMSLSNFNAIDFGMQEVKAPKEMGKINLADLDFYTKKAFPPCMKTLMSAYDWP